MTNTECISEKTMRCKVWNYDYSVASSFKLKWLNQLKVTNGNSQLHANQCIDHEMDLNQKIIDTALYLSIGLLTTLNMNKYTYERNREITVPSERMKID